MGIVLENLVMVEPEVRKGVQTYSGVCQKMRLDLGSSWDQARNGGGLVNAFVAGLELGLGSHSVLHMGTGNVARMRPSWNPGFSISLLCWD